MSEDAPVSTPNLSTITLEKIRLNLAGRISRSALRDMKLETAADVVSQDCSYHLEATLYGKKTTETATEKPKVITTLTDEGSVTYYLSWQDHWKAHVLPMFGKLGEWLLKRYPCCSVIVPTGRTQHVTTHITHHITHITKVCPHLETDPQHQHLRFFVPEPRPWETDRRPPSND